MSRVACSNIQTISTQLTISDKMFFTVKCHFSWRRIPCSESCKRNRFLHQRDGRRRTLSRSVFDVPRGQKRINNPNPSKMLSYDRIFRVLTYLHTEHCLLLSGDISLVDKFLDLRQTCHPADWVSQSPDILFTCLSPHPAMLIIPSLYQWTYKLLFHKISSPVNLVQGIYVSCSEYN